MALDDKVRYIILGVVLVVIFISSVVGCSIMGFCGRKALDDEDDGKSRISALTQSEDGKARKRKVKVEENSDTSSLLEDGAQIKTDKALLETFVKVLTQGITVKLHSPKDKAAKEIKLSMDKNILVWKYLGTRSIITAFKKNKFDIKDIRSIGWGKKTATFECAASALTQDELCISLIAADDKTLDFEVSSKVERDSLAQGFTLLIGAMNSSVESYV